MLLVSISTQTEIERFRFAGAEDRDGQFLSLGRFLRLADDVPGCVGGLRSVGAYERKI
jgi:hypothetical protein